MNPRSKGWILCAIVVTLLFIVGCQTGETDKDIVITFDGETCKYDGPSVISEGERRITLKNNTDWEINIDVAKFDE